MSCRFVSVLFLAGLIGLSTAARAAPAAGTWSYAGKTGIGTAYAPYGAARSQSRVWFSIAHGVLTETMYGLIHEAQLRELSFAIKGQGFIAFEDEGAQTEVSYLKTDAAGRPQALDYRIVNRDKAGRFEIEKHVFTDPRTNTVFLRVIVRAGSEAVTPYLLADPQMASTSGGDRADASPQSLHAYEADKHLVIRASRRFENASAGIAGASDGWAVLKRGETLTPTPHAGVGDVTLAAQFHPIKAHGEATYDVVLGFGSSESAAAAAATASLKRGYRKVRADYEAGWSGYLETLSELPRLAKASTDGGKLLYASAMVLKAQEDKTRPGALIASLSTPWGDGVSAATPQTGYKAVWPRDFYQVASALLALGDRETPVKALDYLKTVQVKAETPGNHGATGWFLQKTHVDGTPEWTGVQLDQTAMPIMLAEKLWRRGLVSDAHLKALYTTSLKPAADFLGAGGHVVFGDMYSDIMPPKTDMERWEEQPGFSPSTTAAEITGLVAAAEIAKACGDNTSAGRYLSRADAMAGAVEKTTFTIHGVYGDGRYFERLSPDGDPNSSAPLLSRNGKTALPQQRYLDAGFLELVRYGARRADAAPLRQSLGKLDDETLPDSMRLRYDFHFAGDPGVYPGWRRYGDDGYGEDSKTGAGFGSAGSDGHDSPDQRGRVWPIFTGERGHYEIALATLNHPITLADRDRIRQTYARGMEHFANPGLMLPEQVYDGVGVSGGSEPPGQGTGSATPLAWSHAEYVKLLRSLADGRVWDHYDGVAARYAH